MMAVNIHGKCFFSTLVVILSVIVLLLLFFYNTPVSFSQGQHSFPPVVTGYVFTNLNDVVDKGKKETGNKSSSAHRELPRSKKQSNFLSSLPTDLIERVEKFVFFIGNSRSGHSIVGSFLDAHPHMVIAHEFMLFSKEKHSDELFTSKKSLFTALYQSSVQAAMHGWRNESQDVKSYMLSVDSPWVGKYDGYISVIGDKSGGSTANAYATSAKKFTAHYQQLKRTLQGTPIKVIHCIRNPYDMVATNTLYAKAIRLQNAKFVAEFRSNLSKLENNKFKKARFNEPEILEIKFNLFTRRTEAAMKIIELVGEQNVLDIHNSDLVNDPNSTLTEICDFLEVKCSPEYFHSCSEKVFKSTSKSRDMVVWPQSLRDTMDSLIEKYTFLNRYSFTSE